MNPGERRDLSKRPFINNNPEEADVSAKEFNAAVRKAEQGVADTTRSDSSSGSVFQELTSPQKVAVHNDIDMIMDIPVQLTVQLGRTKIAIKNLLQLAQGSVVELDGLAGEPMDVLVNGYLIAQGEVVVVNEKFGIRLTDIITPSERIRKLNR